MKKVIAYLDDSDQLFDKEHFFIGSVANCVFEEYKEPQANQEADIVQLVSLGVSADELIKMKAAGLL